MADEKEKEVVEITPEQKAADLRGIPRPDEDYSFPIGNKTYQLVPATLRDIPKIAKLIQEVTEGETEETDLAMLSESKMVTIAEIIHLSLSKEDRKKVSVEVILDNCTLDVFPMAIQAALSMNNFVKKMGNVSNLMGMVT